MKAPKPKKKRLKKFKPQQPKVLGYKEPGRNEACPCTSGKKYKNCCFINS